jgi:threonine synthase
MSSFADGMYALRCRVCEEMTDPTPLETCRRCDGATDIAYDWEHLRGTITPAAIAAGAPSLWRYEALLPTRSHAGVPAGWTPLELNASLSELLGVELLLKVEGANPTGSYKDRIASVAVAAAADYGFSTVCCSSTGNLGDAVSAAAAATGLEAMVLAPAGVGAGMVAARHPGARVLAIDGTYDDCRRLELELGALFPWGFVSGNLHPYASEGAKTISFEIAEGSSPIADAFAADRGISRVEAVTDVPSLSVGDPSHGDLALGAARASGGAVHAVSDEAIAAHTALLSETAGIEVDCAGGAAFGALAEAMRRGEIERGSRVVLVVTGSQPAGDHATGQASEALAPDVDRILAALGLGS